MQKDRPIVLSIAGFDPTGGAGVLADVKTLEQLQVYGMAVLTANTCQTTERFYQIEWTKLEDIVASVRRMMNTYPISTIKIGVVPDVAYLNAILSAIISENSDALVVWDPVLSSTTGFSFFNTNALNQLVSAFPKLQLITPNQMEYEQLKRHDLIEDILAEGTAILLKGGHGTDKGVDILFEGDKQTKLPPGEMDVYDKHGSGCVLSAAIAAYLARGLQVEEACIKGKQYVEQFLRSNSSLLGYHHE